MYGIYFALYKRFRIIAITTEDKIISIFLKVKIYFMNRSRPAKLDHFYSLCDTNSSVLDVGVSSNEHNDSVNMFLKNFRLNSNQYTGLAVQPMDEIRKKYPQKKFVEYPGGIFPFAENEFDWVFSNAVIEHVGNGGDQLVFLNEMLRVGRNVFFSTPNKGFPIESHTDVFFRHWFDDSFYKWCKINKPFWSIENLFLFGIDELNEIMVDSNAEYYKIQKNRMIGWPMIFTVVCSKENG
jgi:hypothetical protein